MGVVKSNEHILGLDLLRFAAAALVVIWHFTFWGWTGAVREPPPRTYVAFPELSDWTFFGIVGVQIFFVISGFVIAASATGSSAGRFLRSRTLRLMPILWACATVALLFRLMQGEALPALVRPYLSSMLVLPIGPYIDGVIWTLAVEVVFYGLTAAVVASGRFGRGEGLAWALAGWSGCFWLAMLVIEAATGDWEGSIPGLHWAATIVLLKHACYFAVGMFLWILLRHGVSRASLIGLAGAVVVCIAGLWLTYGERFDSAVPIWVWLGAVAGLVASVRWNNALHQSLSPLFGTIRTIGLMTYPLYLIHYVPGLVLLGRLADAGVPRYVALGVSIVVCLAASFALVRFFEPPARALLAALLDRIPSPRRLMPSAAKPDNVNK